MEEDFEFGFTEDPKFSVERYEEMIRNHDQYFFDAQAFENIIDYYIEKNDPAKALQVVEYACKSASLRRCIFNQTGTAVCRHQSC